MNLMQGGAIFRLLKSIDYYYLNLITLVILSETFSSYLILLFIRFGLIIEEGFNMNFLTLNLVY